jgi:hypothetical protein
MWEVLRVDQTKVYENTNIDITILVGGVSCSYICIFISYGSYVVSEFNKEEWSHDGVCFNTYKQNRIKYSTTHKEAIIMFFALHKFKHYLLVVEVKF